MEELRRTARNRNLTSEQLTASMEEYLEKITLLSEKINKGMKEVNDNIDGVSLEVYIDSSAENYLKNNIRLRFTLKDIKIGVYSGNRADIRTDKHIFTLDYNNEILAEFRIPLVDFISDNLRGNINQIGRIKNNSLKFPYIARSRTGWGTLCLDKFQDEVTESIKNLDLPSIARSLIWWSSFYHNTRGNPYNNIQEAMIGYPEECKEIFPTLAPSSSYCFTKRLSPHIGLNESISTQPSRFSYHFLKNKDGGVREWDEEKDDLKSR